MGQTSGEVRTMRKGLAADWEERHATPPTPMDEANRALAKAVASFLDDDCTRAQATRVTEWVYKSFGRRGGQAIPYDRELAARLTLTKALTPDEHQRWKDHDRLPDHVDLAHPRAHAAVAQQQASSLYTQHAYAALGLSPLVFGSLARRR